MGYGVVGSFVGDDVGEDVGDDDVGAGVSGQGVGAGDSGTGGANCTPLFSPIPWSCDPPSSGSGGALAFFSSDIVTPKMVHTNTTQTRPSPTF